MDNAEIVARNILFQRETNFNELLGFVVLCRVQFSAANLQCIENTFHKYIVVRYGDGVLSVRGHGRIGMPGFPDTRAAIHADLVNFQNEIFFREIQNGFYSVNAVFLNAAHLIFGQPESQLPEAVGRLLMDLLNEYMPTGILNINQIEQAEYVLNTIRQQLTRRQLFDVRLTIRFYEMIPQNGSLERLHVINNSQILGNKIEVVSRLRSALESIYAGVRSTINPIDYFARYWLRTQLHEINQNTEEFQNINRCITQTQHSNEWVFNLANAFKVTLEADIAFTKDMPNQRLLYHFTFPCNILGILREGLRMAPRHIHSENRFHGVGIYFWDCASMALSAYQTYQIERPVLLVCRVALGNVQEVGPMYLNQDQVFPLENGINSIFKPGDLFSNVANDVIEFNGAEMCCGPVASSIFPRKFEFYNKYMIQRENQVKIEYILQFDRNNSYCSGFPDSDSSSNDESD